MKRLLQITALCFIGQMGYSQCVTPADPTAVMATPNTVCSDTGAAIILNATSTGNTILWYTDAVGGVSIGNSLSGANFSTNTSGTVTYYAESVAYGSLTNQVFNYTGGIQFFVVPFGIDSVQIDALGGAGGNGPVNTGGLGGQATGWLNVNGGDTLWIYVGGVGENHNAGGGVDYEALGGWNGGGKGGYDNSAQTQNGAGGGGASDVRYLDTTLADRVIVAAGGGGSDGGAFTPANGGAGGGLTGLDGGFTYSAAGGTGGTQIGGGLAATTTRGATNGSLGLGGNGSTNQDAWGSGGGGGGYYGGGGGTSLMDHGSGHAGAGGGGSSYIDGVMNGTTNTGVQAGNGMVTLSYSSVCFSLNRTPVVVTINPLPTVVATGDTTFCQGGMATLIATGADSYTWNNGGGANDTAMVSPTNPTTYIVTGTTTATGCINTDTVSVTVVDCSGIADENDLNLSVYPNPTSGQLFINANGTINGYEIFDVYGKVYQVSSNQGQSLILNLENLSGGIYFIKLNLNNRTITRRIVKI